MAVQYSTRVIIAFIWVFVNDFQGILTILQNKHNKKIPLSYGEKGEIYDI